MNLNYDNIKNASIEEIYQYLLKEYQKMFNNYKYAFKSYDDFLNILKDILKDIISSLPNNTSFDYKKYILNQSKNKLNNYFNKLLNSEDVITILNIYINDNLDENNKDVLKELNKLIIFLQKYNYIPNPNVIIEIVKNNGKLNRILAKIVHKNLPLIIKCGLDSVFENEIIYELIDIYCSLNNINYTNIANKQNIDVEAFDEFKGTYTGASAIINDIKSKDLYVLTPEEEKELALKIKLGDQDAYNKFLNHNLRLVVNIANRYVNYCVEYEDLIQEGCIGLLKALEKFDVEKGFKFSTYASWWIRQAIRRAISNDGRNIRLPVHKLEDLQRFKRKLAILTSNLGYEPSVEEISKHLEMPIAKVNENIYLLQDTISLNNTVTDEEETELGNFIPVSSSTLEDDIIEKNLITEIEDLLVKAGLTDIERDIIKYRYGLNYSEEKKLEDIGKIYGVSRERIRQKESTAIKKLRKSPLTKDFAYYLDNPDKSIERLHALINWHYKHPNSNTVYSIDADRLLAKKSNKARRRKLKTIFEQIPGYSKEEILNAIDKLNEEDREVFYLRNGEDLEHPKCPIDSNEDLGHKYYLVVLKIKRKLKHPIKKIQSIYKCLEEYSKEEIDIGIALLNDEDKKIIYYRYGKDLENPVSTDLWDYQKHSSLLYVTIFDRIKRNIANIKGEGKITMSKKLLTIYQKLNNHTKEEIDSLIAKLPEEDKKIFYLRNGEDLEHPIASAKLTPSDKVKYYKIVDKMARQLNYSKEISLIPKKENNPASVELIEFYLRTIELLKSPQFIPLLINNTVNDAIILAIIINSYIEHKSLKVEDIASLLDEDIDIVSKDLKRVLTLFKYNIDEYLDNTINNTDFLKGTTNERVNWKSKSN